VFAEGFVGREGMQHFDDRCEPLEQLVITLPEFVKLRGLFLEYIKDRFGAVAAIDPGGEWVVTKIIPCLLGVLCQGGIEKHIEMGGRGGRIRS